MPVPLLLRRAPAVFALLLGLCAQARADDAPRPGASGNDGHLWLAAPAAKAADGWRLLHRDPEQKDEASLLPHGLPAAPLALPDGAPAICSRGGVFYAATRAHDGSIQLAQWQVGAPSTQGMALTRRGLGTLPADTRVLALAASRRDLWLAVVAVPANLQKQAEASAASPTTDALPMILGLPPGALDAPAAPPSAAPAKDSLAPATTPRLMLLRIRGGDLLPIPATLPPADRAWLASDGDQVLFADAAHRLWQVTERGLTPQGDPGAFTHLLFAGHTALLANINAKPMLDGAAWKRTLQARWRIWDKAATPQSIPNGECSLPLEAGDGQSVVDWAGQPALVRVADSFKPSLPAAFIAPVDLHGTALTAFAVREARDRQQAQMEVVLIQVATATAAIVLMIWSWRQGVRRFPKLPHALVRAGLLRRLMAAMVDLALAMAPVTLLSGVPAKAIAGEWPFVGEPTSLMDMRLGFLVGALFITHTMAGELLAGRSLGKALTGLRVAGLDGKPAAPWRIVVRGLFKWLELLSPALAALAVFSPFGQRLGDLLAGTVVVQAQAEKRP